MKQKMDVLVLTFACFVLLALTPSAGGANGIAAVTTPSADVTLSFTQPGLIAEVKIAQGDRVEREQVLVQQYDAVERAQFRQIEAQSKNTSQLQASEASLAQKRVDLRKLERAAARDAATELEVEHAKLEVRMAELSLEIAELEHAQNQMKCEEAQIRLEKMAIRSPIAGYIEKVEVEPGESINALADVVRVVRIDPLWIDVPVPLQTGRQLAAGQAAEVGFPDSPSAQVQGTVTFVAAVADAASVTLLVRVEVPNKAGRPAGEHVRVHFSATK